MSKEKDNTPVPRPSTPEDKAASQASNPNEDWRSIKERIDTNPPPKRRKPMGWGY